MDKKENLIETFLIASIKYGEAIESGDHKKANSQSNTIRKIRKQLSTSCELELLIPCMQHENDYVKLNVASSLITLLPNDSKKILQKLEKKKGLLGFEAKMFLQEWEKGNIKI